MVLGFGKSQKDAPTKIEEQAIRIKPLISWAADGTPLQKKEVDKKLKNNDLEEALDQVLKHYVTTTRSIHSALQRELAYQSAKGGLQEAISRGDTIAAVERFIAHHQQTIVDSRSRLRDEEDARQMADSQVVQLKFELGQLKRDMTQSHQREVARLQQEHQEQAEAARQKAQAEKDYLQKDNDAFRSVLVARQQVKGLSDPEISAQFKRLAILIDNFSRLEWTRSGKEPTWPVPAAILGRLPHPRKTKQHIVQCSVWLRLHDNIFSSPFKLFGAEGHALHQEWVKGFSNSASSFDGEWPDPTELSEDYRSEAIKRCMLSLKESNSSERRRLQEEYNSILHSTVDEILQDCERIAELADAQRIVIQDVVRIAAEFWLAVSAHKCRITVAYPSSVVNPLKTTDLGMGSVLIVQPEVRRRGNAKGERLDREQVVKGCEGELERFGQR